MYENKIYKLANCRLVQMRLHIHMNLHVRPCIVSVYAREFTYYILLLIGEAVYRVCSCPWTGPAR
jgi:hypothetical protein